MYDALATIEQARKVAAQALARSKEKTVHPDEMEVRDYTALGLDWIVQLLHPDFPYLQVWVQKRGGTLDTKIWEIADRYTSTTADPTLF